MQLQLQAVTPQVTSVRLALPAAIELSFGSAGDIRLTLPAAVQLSIAPQAVTPSVGVDVRLILPAAVGVSVDLGNSLGTAIDAVRVTLPAALPLSLGLQQIAPSVTTPVTLTLPATVQLSVTLDALTPSVSSAVLRLAGSDVKVEHGGHRLVREPLGLSSRGYGGGLRVGVHPSRAHRSVWSIRTPLLDRSDAQTLETTLTAAGRITATGTLVGDTSRSVYARNVERQDTRTLQHASVRFELHEAD